MDKSRIFGAIAGLVIGVGIGIGVIFYFKLFEIGLISQIGMCAGIGALGGLLGGVFGVQLG